MAYTVDMLEKRLAEARAEVAQLRATVAAARAVLDSYGQRGRLWHDIADVIGATPLPTLLGGADETEEGA